MDKILKTYDNINKCQALNSLKKKKKIVAANQKIFQSLHVTYFWGVFT